MSGERKDKGGEDGGDGAAGGEAQAVGARAPGNHGGQRDGEKLKEQRELRLGGG